MAPSLFLQRLLLILCAGTYVGATGRGFSRGRCPRRLSAGFLGTFKTVPPHGWFASLTPSDPVFFKDPVSLTLGAAAKGTGAPQRGSRESPLLTFLDWGRGLTAPGSSEELLHQQQLQGQAGNHSQVYGLLYCTSWDPRSKALVSAIRLLQKDAVRAIEGHHICEDGPPKLPLYPILGVRITNSLVVARGRRALLKQRRMACNMKQLRHNERALRFMLQQQPPLQLRGLPAFQLYAQQQHEDPKLQRGNVACTPSMQQLLEIRSVGPRTLKQLGEDEGALLGAWGHQGPPGGPPEAGLLAAWLRRLGQLYEDELKQIVEERLQQAEEEYPIYTYYSP
ncbi:hypothetical protein, conserved [Eimeria maxima]|uniref:Uncharacterized protein n=1 Tax=Eimeria maxima TaxID=5804 RepID=U6MBL3_EIMMA|nr:hypothetical protein, conserved [Eimeria maxima]CDJ59874.1 hypothetical protein, conserved [Eimeria maxima]